MDNSGSEVDFTDRWRKRRAPEKVSVRKVKEVLGLRFGLGLQQNQIARSCSIGQATVHRYLEEKIAAAGLKLATAGRSG